jgi:hypothetical protein
MIKRHRNVTLILLLAIASSLVLTAIVLGQAGGSLDLSWSTIAGGGGESEGGRYTLKDSQGQGVASSAPSTDGDRFSLTDGFWQIGSAETKIYLPFVSRNNS